MEREIARRIGLAARAARNARGESQADTAERVGISLDFYARIERGQTMPSVPTLVRIARALEVSTDTLLGPRKAAVLAPAAPGADTPDVRRLIRRVRQARPKSVRVLNIVAAALNER